MDKQIIQARTLSGFRDLLPQEALAKEDMIRTVSDIFRSFSFAPIETPHLEYEETLVDISEDDVQKEMYRFEDHGGRRVALRFDQTLPLARYVVEHKNDLALPFRRYAIGNVFRGERPQKGRYREFTQCDFDCVGSDSSAVDAEVIAITAAAITVLGISDFTIAISNRKILNGYLQTLHLESQAESILRIVDKKAKISAEEFERLLTENCNGDTALAHDIAQSVSLSWEDIQMKQGHNDLLDQGIQELEQIISLLAALGVDAKNYTIDLSIVRGLGYYTGMVFETTLDALPNFGSVCSGGRYDTLTQKFSKELTPATGAGL
ncbi:MAG: histidine--tRNA ligase [Patescibacteria group bacterium]|nr:histidine--tRNA ligase [Patescibacteria group bacterium]